MADQVEFVSLHGFVSGRVQGVFFRAATQRQAQALGLRGWVRNCRDGRVELLLHGAPEALASMRVWLASGPPMASVQEVQLQEPPALAARDIPAGFEITG
ncbi:MAG: hypothetical protein RLZZ385_1891 [Pseudomonadota bacterium]|jgi:acylphosphatase